MKLFFIQRLGDGKIFSRDEVSAYHILNGGNWQRRDFKLLGTCDAILYGEGEHKSLCGTEYIRIIEEARGQMQEEKNKIEQLKNEREKYFSALEKLLYEDMLSKDDERIKRGNAIIDKYNEDIEKLQNEFDKKFGNIHERAFEVQLEKAKLTIEPPDKRNVLITAPNASEKDLATIKGNVKL